MKQFALNIVAWIGVALMVLGIWQVYPPASLIVGGIMLTAFAYFTAMNDIEESDE